MSRLQRIPPVWRLVIALAVAEAVVKVQLMSGVNPPGTAVLTIYAVLLTDPHVRKRWSTVIAVFPAVALVWVTAWQLGERASWVAAAGAVATLVSVRRWRTATRG